MAGLLSPEQAIDITHPRQDTQDFQAILPYPVHHDMPTLLLSCREIIFDNHLLLPRLAWANDRFTVLLPHVHTPLAEPSPNL